MKKFSIFFFFMIYVNQHSFSQSEFIQRGKSSFGGGLGFSINRETNGLNLYGGYSYQGFLDVNLMYSKTNSGQFRDGVISPSITFYPVKQEDAKNAPTLGVSLGFSQYRSKTTSFVDVPAANMQHRIDTLVTESMVTEVGFGVNVYRGIGYWNVFTFQPMLGAGLSFISSHGEFTLRGGIAIETRIVRGPLLILTPIIVLKSDLMTFMLAFGAVL
jgi:hypothetical protein